MAEDTEEKPSLWEKALDTYRDVEIAKRSQPLLVQGIQQVQTPLQRNNDAVVQGPSSVGGVLPVGGNTMLYMGLGLVALAGVIVALKKRRK